MIKKFFYLSICVGALIALNSCEQDSDSEQKPSEKDVIPVEVIVAKEIEIGSSFDITAVLQNQGDTIISKPSVTKVYLSKDKLINGDDDVFIGEVVLQTKLVPNIAVQEKITIDSEEILKNIELGAYYVILEADSSNVIDEVNEENNVYVTSFTIEFKEKADEEVPDEMEVEALGKDLTILEITTDKTEYTRLEKFEANVLFKVGSEDIEEFSVTNFYLSADKILNKENDTYVGFSSFRNSKASADIEENISGGANQFGINALSGSYYLIAEMKKGEAEHEH